MMFGAITLHQSGEREISSSPCSTAAASPTAGGPGLALVRNVRWAVTVCRLVEPSALVAGYGLYYPERRLASPALRALIEHLRRWRARRQAEPVTGPDSWATATGARVERVPFG
jgi:DNA-binding transcriptional LysR family regulator